MINQVLLVLRIEACFKELWLLMYLHVEIALHVYKRRLFLYLEWPLIDGVHVHARNAVVTLLAHKLLQYLNVCVVSAVHFSHVQTCLSVQKPWLCDLVSFVVNSRRRREDRVNWRLF